MQLQREQQDVIAPGIWLTFLVSIAFFAREHLLAGAVISTLILGIYYAARDAAQGQSHD
jgi:hypothetical protein